MTPSAKQKPTVVVTGSSGLIGSCLCEALAHDYMVFGLDVQRPKSTGPGVEWTECDLTSEEGTKSALDAVANLAGKKVASVVHLAAYYDFSGEPSPLYKQLTVEGTRRLLHGLRSFEVEQILFSSSLLVMEPVEEEGEVLDEHSSTRGEWAYPKSKLAAERVIRAEHGNIPAAILRFAGVYDEDCNSIPISQQISRIYEQKLESHFFPGDASHGQPFIHIDDLTDCFQKVIARRNELDPLEVFLIAEDELLSYEEVQNRVGVLLYGEEWSTIRVPKALAKAGAWVKDALSPEGSFIKPWMIDLADDHYPVNIQRARERLGWQPKHRLSETLKVMIRRLQDDPQRWYEINKLGEAPEPPQSPSTDVLAPDSRPRTPK